MPNDPEPQMMLDLRRAGFDPRQVHIVDHYLYFPSPEAAGRAVEGLRDKGYVVRSGRGANGNNWLVLASHRITPATADIVALLEELERYAAGHGGEYDGWEAGPAE